MKTLCKANILRVSNQTGRYLLAGIFLLSGISKFFYLKGFSMEVAQYCELYLFPSLSLWSGAIAVMVCCVEICMGISMTISRLSKIASILALSMLTFFLYLTGINYFSPTLLGSVESCGCFGELIHFTSKGSFIKTAVLWVVAFFVLVTNKKRLGGLNLQDIKQFIN